MVEAGMCRSKNAVNILTKNLFVFALAVTAYWFVGFSIMYGDQPQRLDYITLYLWK